jgi:hypothetical protein
MPHRPYKYVCIACRTISKTSSTCVECQQPTWILHHKWRAPKRTNDRAWKRIAAGDWLWELPKKLSTEATVVWNGRAWVTRDSWKYENRRKIMAIWSGE